MDKSYENKKKAYGKFLDKQEEGEQVIRRPDGLVERIDKKLVTESGKTLLRERIY